MAQALYRKYRSTNFNEVVGQQHVTDTLARAIEAGRISHAYLFTGPRGVGKTSVARLLAYAVNNLKYSPEANHLDIIEIDAASNRRIDEVRDIRDKVHTMPAAAKYKVYIIDEVHMLTREAFNALLKTLEEPPAHCVFVLATTEAHKLPDTIISRTQRFTFKPVSTDEVARHLAKIAAQEGIKADEEVLNLMAQYGEGSVRDSLSLLDQLSGQSKTISRATVQEMLGLPPAGLLEETLAAIQSGDSKGVIRALEKLWEQGASPASLSSSLGKIIREKLIAEGAQIWMSPLLKELIEVPASSSPRDYLEIALLEAAAQAGQGGIEDNAKAAVHAPAKLRIDSPSLTAEKIPINSKATASRPLQTQQIDLDQWPEVVARAKKEAASLYTAIRLVKPRVSRGELLLAFEFPLHQKKVSTAKNLDTLKRILQEVYKKDLKLKCIVDKEVFGEKAGTVSETASIKSPPMGVHAINNIFGPAEVLKSRSN